MSSVEVVELKADSDTEMEIGEVVKWERLFPSMALRVLLIEADDSTRQIIAALLRKSNYTVAAVADGLKAWEVLKGKPHNIDLILTEVELPSISGFALLTLIMEHEICKSIPVIMMSSQDSISTVYKCMLRGAVDYLVKPIRRNELRNLWQHVWRRQSLIIGRNFPEDESIGHKQVEATTSENNAVSNHSGGRSAGVRRNKGQTVKGGDAQGSCTTPDMEAESVDFETLQGFSDLMKGKSQPSESQMKEARANLNQNLLMRETNVYNGVVLESHRTNTNILVEAGYALVESPREAIDFIGAFNRNCDFSSINSSIKFDSSPHLDLSLRRFNHNVFKNNNATQERPILWDPNSSAFTRYSSTPSHPLHSTMTSVSNQQEPPVHVNQFHQSSFKTNSFERFDDRLASDTNQLTNRFSHKLDQKLDSIEDKGRISHTTNQSGTSSLCNGSLSQLKGIAYGSSGASNSNVDQIAILRGDTERKNDDDFTGSAGNSYHSIQREAALNKFRLKRKDRCYDKKVRYESRKKLAEQRPRVKGQFVRQLQVNHTAEYRYGNSYDD